MPTYIENLRSGISRLLENDKDVYLIGEDIAEPYGGAFKVTKGLSERFPDRLISPPMSEQGFTGMAIGMAIAGFRPIVEIMFGDFITLLADQLINHASKFTWLYDKDIHLVVRTPMGGYRGYGATHSQSIERIYFGIPNLFVVAPSIVEDPGKMIERSVNKGKAVLFIENKLDYSRQMIENDPDLIIEEVEDEFGIKSIKLKDADDTELTILTYGGMVKMAIDIQRSLFLDEEISIKVLTFAQLSPIQNRLIDLIGSDKNLLVLEEGVTDFGWSDAILSKLIQNGFQGSVEKIGAKAMVIGASQSLEEFVLPSKNEIKETIVKMVNSR